MGLNIAIYVKKQREGYGEEGRNPKGDNKQIEADFFDYLHKRFPDGGFGGGWANESKGGSAWPFDGAPYYEFNVRMFRYGDEFEKTGHTMTEMWLAITEYIYENFSHMEGIQMQTSWSW